jgi:beta-lactamase regulating signal transducer with metallopeptidase domain
VIAAGGVAFIAAADSARAVAAVYTVSLLATLPVVIAAIVAFALRQTGPEARTLVWRSCIIALLAVYVGRQLPLHWMAWVVPSTLAAPLVALGRVQVTAGALRVGASDTFGRTLSGPSVVQALLMIYFVGVAISLGWTIAASFAMRLVGRRARALTGARWTQVLAESQRAVGLKRSVRLRITPDVTVPMTWGIVRPVIALPMAAGHWTDDQRAIVLRHELAHVQAADWLFALAARAAGAVYWFHPGVWWIGRQMLDDCELVCDGRVIAAGVRRSDYAELLVEVASSRGARGSLAAGLALAGRHGLRGRLVAMLDSRRTARPVGRRWIAIAAAVTLAVAGPMSAVQLAPTRAVLTTLMRDARWESRAYAVLRLAQRPDSIAVARDAAVLDPSPRVRAWARYALGETDTAATAAGILEPPTLLRR